MIDLLRRATSVALDAALPAACVGCEREGPPLCDACLPALDRRLEQPAGVPIGLPGDLPAPLLQLDWCAPFSGTVRAALHVIKYGGEQRLAEPLGADADRARTRGYDQAALIARAAARHLGLPYAPLLARQRATIAQFDLDRGDRAANVAGAFVAGPGAADPSCRWVLLVDDVVTTGATLAACAEALERAGAMGTSAITVARER